MKQYYLFADPSLYAVIGMNVYLIILYQQNPDSIHTILVFYWIQNVLIGLFNFLDMLTVQKIKKGSSELVGNSKAARGCSSFFFLIHYGGFQVGYFFFLLFKVDYKKLNWHYIHISFWILFAGMAINFIINKIRNAHTEMDLSSMFFLPYFRIVPMHLMILAPTFLHISSFSVFLILKTIFDVLMHAVSNIILIKQASLP